MSKCPGCDLALDQCEQNPCPYQHGYREAELTIGQGLLEAALDHRFSHFTAVNLGIKTAADAILRGELRD